jgi:hypothetical protein
MSSKRSGKGLKKKQVELQTKRKSRKKKKTAQT